MGKTRCNPYIDAPISLKGVCLMTLATIVFVIEVIYGSIRGFWWFGFGKKEKNNAKFDRFHLLMHSLMKMNLRLHPWLNCSVYNPYDESFDGGAIAICNHQSLLDTLCMLILSPKILIIANKRVIHNRIVRLLLYYAEFACIESSIEGLLAYCKKQAQRGYTIVIFPEGLRSKWCDIQRFHSGAFYLASQLGLDIIPLFIHGSGYALPVGRCIQNNAAMSVEIGKRIKANELNQNAREQAKLMKSYYEIHYDRICQEREIATYFRPLVASYFHSIKVRYKAQELINRYNCFSEWINRKIKDNSCIYIDDGTDGLFSLFLALVHPKISIYVCGASELKSIYEKYRNLPCNIHFLMSDQKNTMKLISQVYMIENLITVYKINILKV